MDLIERLRARANEERAVPDMGHNAAERERSKLIRLLTEAADALESAREWIKEKGEQHNICTRSAIEQEVQTLRELLADADHVLSQLGACDIPDCDEPCCLKVRQRIAAIAP